MRHLQTKGAETVRRGLRNVEFSSSLLYLLVSERALIVERTQAGLKAAKERGAKLGRKPALSEDQRKHARELLDRGESPAADGKLLKVCRATLYNSLKE